jgi:hypothetical protein
VTPARCAAGSRSWLTQIRSCTRRRRQAWSEPDTMRLLGLALPQRLRVVPCCPPAGPCVRGGTPHSGALGHGSSGA